WPQNGHPRRAAVSSFGISGTNAHIILEEIPLESAPTVAAPPPETKQAAETQVAVPWLLSARSPAALRAKASQLTAHLAARRELAAADVALSLPTTRATQDHRAVLVGTNRDDFTAGLDALAAGQPHQAVVQTVAAAPRAGWAGGGTVFVFPGQGSQHLGMAA